jgi:hypothetical protein
MKLAILLPGYLDSPDYLHMSVFSKRLIELGFEVRDLKKGERINHKLKLLLDSLNQNINFKVSNASLKRKPGKWLPNHPYG